MRSTRVYAFLVIITLLGSVPVVAQDRTATPPPPTPPALLQGSAPSYKGGSYLAQKRARILALQAEEERVGQSPELLPAIVELAEWYEQWGTSGEARPMYRRAVKVIEDAYGTDDLRLVAPLSRIASTYEQDHDYRSEGREALERIVHLYAASDSAAEQADAVIRLGDWQLVNNDRAEAIATYTSAWSMLVAMNGGSSSLAVAKLGRPSRVRYSFEDAPPSPTSPAVGLWPAATESYTVVTFTVTPDGFVENVVVGETTNSARVTHIVRVAASTARYRPAFEDGKPVEAQVTLIQRSDAVPGWR